MKKRPGLAHLKKIVYGTFALEQHRLQKHIFVIYFLEFCRTTNLFMKMSSKRGLSKLMIFCAFNLGKMYTYIGPQLAL